MKVWQKSIAFVDINVILKQKSGLKGLDYVIALLIVS